MEKFWCISYQVPKISEVKQSAPNLASLIQVWSWYSNLAHVINEK